VYSVENQDYAGRAAADGTLDRRLRNGKVERYYDAHAGKRLRVHLTMGSHANIEVFLGLAGQSR
jgi:hypothetical protein